MSDTLQGSAIRLMQNNPQKGGELFQEVFVRIPAIEIVLTNLTNEGGST